MRVICTSCRMDFDWPKGSMQGQCPRCGKKLKPTDVLLHTERENVE